MTTKLAIVLDKCKVSKNDAMHLLMAAAEALHIDPKSLISNSKSIHESRKKCRQERYEDIKEFAPRILTDLPSTVHWDGKILKGLLRKQKTDRVAILVTSREMKQIIGTPEILSGTGENQANAVYESLVNCSLLDNVEALCCDSTICNTGRIKGACTILEKLLNKDLLCFICRHHIYELVLRSVFELKFGSTSGVNVQEFTKFKNFWTSANKQEFESGLTDDFVKDSLKDDKDMVLKFCFNQLKINQARSDYQEFLELVIIFLEGELTNGIVFHPPGAHLHA